MIGLARVELPGKRTVYRWITLKRANGRYMARAPKIGTRIRNLQLLRDTDYEKEGLLPLGAKIRAKTRKSRR
jgi:hypothetical protein